MLGMFLPARRQSGSLISALSLAVALAGGAVVGTAATSSTALAQNRGGQAAPKYSPNFAKVYQPVATIANAADGDAAAARGQMPGVIAAAQTADDRFAAGNLAVQIGTKAKDPVLQRQGLELMRDSGKVDPAQLGQVHFFIGQLAYTAKDYAAARTALQAAIAAGRTADNPEALIAESYFGEGAHAQGLDYLKGVIAQRKAAGTAVDDAWIRRGLQIAYDRKMVQQANEWSALLGQTNPSPANWATALQVVGQINDFDQQAQLDLFRLMATANAMTQRADYVGYIEAADARIMSNEVDRVLKAGTAANIFTPADNFYKLTKDVVDQRAAADRSEAPKLVADARKAGNGTAALTAGDVLYSLGSYAEAEEMYKLALEKGGTDRDRVLTRLGIAQAQQGKSADAKAAFGQVSGARAPIAQMWSAYLATKA